MLAYIIRHKKVVVALAIAFPFILNFLIVIPKPTWIPVVGNASDWIVFWATYVSALASFAMVVAAYETLDESRKQWKEDHTAHLNVTAYRNKYHQVFLCIGNLSSIGIIVQSIQLYPEPSKTVKDLICLVKSYKHSDNYMDWQNTYEYLNMTIRPYDSKEILFLNNFSQQIKEEVSISIKYNNKVETFKIDLNNIFISQDNV